MRVYKLSFRTPGIFLDEEGNNFTGNLTFEVETGEGIWQEASEVGLQVIPADHFRPNTAVTTLVTASIAVPKRNDGLREYYVLMEDDQKYNFRIVADHCPDCFDFFRETGQGEERILDNDRNGRIVVGTGFFGTEEA